ncbi:hypothetical protein [Chelativorans salis]|uniref:Uncharacterized protein n=1 Tax=Chelativorans salis TaxID=2978478 RepID=A0ABT2LNQ3_9HYPH|nr:hypothetical protein [Chelativorans sp. EGI FJ00035]MCT7375477.1 hypothetical protein [Chelativorans sp. EGI FJ00035]
MAPFDSTAITDADGSRIGLSFAAGQNGVDGSTSAFIQIREKTGDISKLAGVKVTCQMIFEVSETFNPTITAFVTVIRGGVAVPLSSGSASTTTFSLDRSERIGNNLYRDVSFVLTGGESEIRPFVRPSGANAAGTETITYLSHRLVVATVVSSTSALPEQALAAALQRTRKVSVDEAVGTALTPILYAQETILAEDGSGDTTDFRTAYNTLGSGTITEPHAVKIEPGTYTHDAAVVGDVSYIIPNFLDIVGRDSVPSVIQNLQAPADTATNEPLRAWYTNKFSDFTAIGKNVRYTFHNDAGGSHPDNVQNFERVRAIHLGNQGAYDYQVSLGGAGDPGAVWMLDRPFGYGTSSGQQVFLDQCYVQGYQRGFGLHDTNDNDKPFSLEIKNTELALTWTDDDETYAFWFAGLGSGQPGSVTLYGVSSTGDLDLRFNPWLFERS